MPTYRHNDDGTLTIESDLRSNHQSSQRSPRPTDNWSGHDLGNDGFPLLRARFHILMVLLDITCVICIIVSVSEIGGEGFHKMSEGEWMEFRASDAPHSVMEAQLAALDGWKPYAESVSTSVGRHDWVYGLSRLAPGTEKLFANLQHNGASLMILIEEWFGTLARVFGAMT